MSRYKYTPAWLRWYSRNRCILQYSGKRRPLLWSLLFPTSNILHRLWVRDNILRLTCVWATWIDIYIYTSSILPPSSREYPIRGLHLIRLLTQNRIAEFHTTLESLPLSAEAISQNKFISHPVNLERWLMEGSYSKVWNARETAPAEEYKLFVDSLMVTIRWEY